MKKIKSFASAVLFVALFSCSTYAIGYTNSMTTKTTNKNPFIGKSYATTEITGYTATGTNSFVSRTYTSKVKVKNKNGKYTDFSVTYALKSTAKATSDSTDTVTSYHYSNLNDGLSSMGIDDYMYTTGTITTTVYAN